MDKAIEQLTEDLNTGRLINATDGLLFPVLKKHEERLVAAVCAKFTGGEKDFISEVAQLAFIRNLTNELKRKQAKGHQAYEALHKNAEQ